MRVLRLICLLCPFPPFSSCLFPFCRLSPSPKGVRATEGDQTDPDVAAQTEKKRTGVCREIPFTWTFPRIWMARSCSRISQLLKIFSSKLFESVFLRVQLRSGTHRKKSRADFFGLIKHDERFVGNMNRYGVSRWKLKKNKLTPTIKREVY